MLSKTPEMAEICAAIIGDGWIESREEALYIAGHKEDDRDYYDNYLAPLFSKHVIQVNPKFYPYWSVYGFNTCKKAIIKEIINLGVKKGKKTLEAEFPSWIFSNREFMIAALRGIFDAEGCFSCSKRYGKYDTEFNKKYHSAPKIDIRMSSGKIIYQIDSIARNLGFRPESVKLKKSSSKTRNNKDVYAFKLNRHEDLRIWFEDLKLSANPKQITRYLIWKKFGFCPTKISLEERKKILSEEVNPYSYYE